MKNFLTCCALNSGFSIPHFFAKYFFCVVSEIIFFIGDDHRRYGQEKDEDGETNCVI